MDLTVKDLVKLFNVTDRTVYRWIQSGNLPFYKVNEQYRFNRVEMLEWATAQKIPVSPEIFAEPQGGALPTLTQAIKIGGIHYRIGGKDKESVFKSIIQILRLPEEVDSEFLLQVLQARESLGSTGIGDGIAIPHARNPIVLHIPKPMVALCFLEHAIEFGALDGKPVNIIFMLVTPTVRSHLHLLSRLAFAIKDQEWSDLLRQPASREELIESLQAIEFRISSNK
jgi:PTS system nitrogen regulatory IIA component